MTTLSSAIKKDKRIIKLFSMIENGTYALNTSSLLNEIESLHRLREVRTLKTETVLHSFQAKFLSAVLQNQAYRSRIVEISMQCFRIDARLSEHLEALRPYLKDKYGEYLSQYKTINDRESVINSVLEPAIRLQKKLNSVIKMAEMAIDDLDQAAWSFKNIIQTMNLGVEKGNSI